MNSWTSVDVSWSPRSGRTTTRAATVESTGWAQPRWVEIPGSGWLLPSASPVHPRGCVPPLNHRLRTDCDAEVKTTNPAGAQRRRHASVIGNVVVRGLLRGVGDLVDGSPFVGVAGDDDRVEPAYVHRLAVVP